MKKWIIVSLIVAAFLAAVLMTASEWDGDITEAAAGPLASGAGVEETHVLPWKIEGDLLLFLFLGGGAAAGFIAGYQWRKLFAENGNRETATSGRERAERDVT